MRFVQNQSFNDTFFGKNVMPKERVHALMRVLSQQSHEMFEINNATRVQKDAFFAMMTSAFHFVATFNVLIPSFLF